MFTLMEMYDISFYSFAVFGMNFVLLECRVLFLSGAQNRALWNTSDANVSDKILCRFFCLRATYETRSITPHPCESH